MAATPIKCRDHPRMSGRRATDSCFEESIGTQSNIDAAFFLRFDPRVSADISTHADGSAKSFVTTSLSERANIQVLDFACF